ncbi:hypothetical protein SeMB42_g07772 [Synchytrium endobioticum]|uniref:Uncharacterized protein n=1 Tax=Synchytrium endobioticum TaxID=286115 RepID=A0A507BPU7_9FUNG|nr:hypothetical protein SeMB42_g07772 [Synchytrium endobioticum]TPX33815.1 hypothetical protein SeLEV6574_g08334 [Synchytrium endobioticum]
MSEVTQSSAFLETMGEVPSVHLSNAAKVDKHMLLTFGVRVYANVCLLFELVDTGKWTHQLLVKYLVPFEGMLTTHELSSLRQRRLFAPEGDDQASARYTCQDLYIPSETLRKLGVKILKWNDWNGQSAEAKFLVDKMGLKACIQLPEWYALMENAATEGRSLLLQYFVDNFDTIYKYRYRPEQATIAFLPTRCGTGAKPTDCFTDAGCEVLGFLILDTQWHALATTFGCKPHPPPQRLIDALQNIKSISAQNITGILKYLAGRSLDFVPSHWDRIRELHFIPVLMPNTTLSTYPQIRPRDLYLNETSEYAGLFYFKSFGKVVDAFLAAAGAKYDPTTEELARRLVSDDEWPRRFLSRLGVDKYKALLHRIAAEHGTLFQDATLLDKMKKTPFLLAMNENMEVILTQARDISLIDDEIVQELFRPIRAPIDPVLEPFYERLGSSWISSQVKTSFTLSRSDEAPDMKLQQVIRERAPLLVYNGNRSTGSSNLDAHAILKNMTVLRAAEMEVVRTFGQKREIQKTTASLSKADVHHLYVTKDYDYFEVARALSQVVCQQAHISDICLLSTLLSDPINLLKKRGFNIERMMQFAKES